MGLLRLTRQGLATRWVESDDTHIRYSITARGFDRLEYLLQVQPHPVRDLNHHGGSDMRRTKTHTGTFHCPTCFVEYELVNEESLKCEHCKGPLADGSLDEVWDGEKDEEDEEDE